MRNAGGGIVLSPDQEMGVSIVGWTATTPMDHAGRLLQPGRTHRAARVHQKASALGLPALYLQAVPDVDTMLDLLHNVTLMEATSTARASRPPTVPSRTLDAVRQLGVRVCRRPTSSATPARGSTRRRPRAPGRWRGTSGHEPSGDRK